LQALRELVSQDSAVLAVDLVSKKQAAVVCDPDSVEIASRARMTADTAGTSSPARPMSWPSGCVPSESKPR
jgi:hypothetical protein